MGDPLNVNLFQVALLDLQSNSKMAALLPYFVYVISGVCFQSLNYLLHRFTYIKIKCT